jgi:hypothetical protein
MIFWGGVGATLVVERQWLATQETQKNRKEAKKSVQYFPAFRRAGRIYGVRAIFDVFFSRRGAESVEKGMGN